MAWSRDTRKPTAYMRGAKRYNDVGGHSPPGDELENTRDHERIWFELRRNRSCCNCDSPGFKYCFDTFDYPNYICAGDFPGGDTQAGYYPGVVHKDSGFDPWYLDGACGGGPLQSEAFTGGYTAYPNGSWRNGPFFRHGSSNNLVWADWNALFPNFDFTFEFWLKPTQADIDGGVEITGLGYADATLADGGFTLFHRTGGGVGIRHIQVEGGALQVTGPGWFEADQWHHVAIVRNTVSATLAIFVNGRLTISRVIPTSGWAASGSHSLMVKSGNWSDLARYTSALTATTIRRHYRAVYGVEGEANPLSSVEGDPTTVQDPGVVLDGQLDPSQISGGGDLQAGSVFISSGDYGEWITPEDSPFELEARKGQPDGYASLDGGALVPAAELAPPSGADYAFLREDQTWTAGRLPPTPLERELRLLSWFEAADGYLAALPSFFSRKWLLDEATFPFEDDGTGGQDFTSGTVSSIDEFGAFGGISCPVFAGGTDGMQTAAVAAASEQFAFSFWLRVDVLPASPVNLIRCGTKFGLRLKADGTVESWIGALTLATSVATVTVGEWHHIWVQHDSVGLDKISRVGIDGVLTTGITNFGGGNGSGYYLAGDGFEGAISVVAACSAETQLQPSAAAILSLAQDYRSLDWSAYDQSTAVGGVDASEDDTPVTAAPRSRLNFKAGTNVTVTVTDDPGDDEVEVEITASPPAGSGIEVSENDADVSASPRGRLNFLDGFGTFWDLSDDGANDEVEITVNLPDATGKAEGDTLSLDSSLQPSWETPAGGGGGGSAWTRLIDESGGSLANWTQVVGTWTTDGTNILLTGAASVVNRLLHSQRVAGVSFASFDFYIDSTAASRSDQRLGVVFNAAGGATTGPLQGLKWGSNSPSTNAQGYAENNGLAAYNGPVVGATLGITQDTWHSMAVLLSGTTVTLWVNGTLVWTTYIQPTAGLDVSRFSIFSYQAKVRIRNIVVDHPPLPS